MTSSLITDFSEFTPGTTWASGIQAWGGTSLLNGQTFTYAGSGATLLTVKTTSNGRLELTGTLTSNFVGFGLMFGLCASASTYTGMSADIGGTLNGAAFRWQLQTSHNKPIDTATGRGECTYSSESTMWDECSNNYLTVSGIGTTVATFKYPWASFVSGKPIATLDPTELYGIQWQFECGSTACAIDIFIDNVKFY